MELDHCNEKLSYFNTINLSFEERKLNLLALSNLNITFFARKAAMVYLLIMINKAQMCLRLIICQKYGKQQMFCNFDTIF